MNLIVAAIVLAILTAVADYFVGIKEPWRKIIYVGLIILFIVGILSLLGLIPNFAPLLRM